MSLATLMTHTVSVKRKTATTGVKFTYQAVTALASVPCLIQPLDPEATERTADSWASDYKAFFAVDADIQKGDKLTDQAGREFSVRGIRLRNYGSTANQHLEALLGADWGSA